MLRNARFLLAAATLVAASSALAATQTWNTGGPTNNWNTSDLNWGGASWGSGNDAVFGGTGESITLSSAVTAHNLTFDVTGYSIAPLPTTNVLTLNGTTPTISVTNLADTATISAIIGGSAGLTKAGAGTLVLTAANTYSGDTNISGGTLRIGTGGSLKNSTNVTIAAGATLNLNDTNVSITRDLFTATTTGALVVNGTLSNTGNGESRLKFGTITMNNGTITCGSADVAFGSFLFDGAGGDRTITANGALNKIDGAGYGIAVGGVTLTFATTTSSDALAVSAALGAGNAGSTSGSIAKTGAGTVTLSGTNTLTGKTTVSGGTLQLAKTASLLATNWTAAKLTVASGATLALNVGGTGEFSVANVNTLLTAISVAGAGTGLQAGAKIGFDTTTAAGGTFTQGNIIANSTGANGGAIGVTKLGTGTLVLDKANTYTGGTIVSAGTLMVAATTGSIQVGAAGVTIASGATLTVNGTLELTSAAATLANSGTVTGSGVIDLNGLFDGYGSSTYALLSLGQNLSGANLTVTGYDTGVFTNVTFDNATGNLNFAAVPEPSTYGLIGAGALAAVAFVRRRRKLAGKVA
jgi:fibronectin-binding autotransporter adhesin